MSYFILRNGQQYGPYSPADIERYLTVGGIVATDLARTEEMNQWLPLAQIIRNTPSPPRPLRISIRSTAVAAASDKGLRISDLAKRASTCNRCRRRIMPSRIRCPPKAGCTSFSIGFATFSAASISESAEHTSQASDERSVRMVVFRQFAAREELVQAKQKK